MSPWWGALSLGERFTARAHSSWGICPELDVSSFGGTPQEAEQSLREAVTAFLDECETLGTLEEVMEEAGFSKQDRGWTPREPVLAELLTTE